ncbi:hypothetical protein M409DRAFT_22394 [Zasmidium cellare ATCC 36951]|uniref:Aminotransferase class I/classII large domain-containing protein n=1 Tax=Zasmidium cellare ATCC 36951 TaxID=1080233 RepID=A0A6A6CKL8_ZASCE|nr:uncharacterized protein M409DRAFT_22394 [Zasmidium cellare ATCC 36951]KAF2167591.1 hypothetical protein M409DRAFT_22394 [Zasmidium cellare ATCC 36951]
MPQFNAFALDDFVFEWGPKVTTGLWDSCVEPFALSELQALDPETSVLSQETQLRYGFRWGLPKLRDSVRGLYNFPDLTADDIVITSGCISANYLLLDTIVNTGDHVIVQHPTYGQLIEVPRRAGAQVSLWKWQWKMEGGEASWSMDFDQLEKMIQPNTTLIVLSSPSNPTGSVLSREDLQRIVDMARARDLIVMCDEVFRFMHHGPDAEAPPSLLELGYEKSIVTGSLSKGFALPGIRLGWIATHPSLRQTILYSAQHSRDYTTIAVSQVDQQVAMFALSPKVRPQILNRTREITQRNIQMLDKWVNENAWVTYAKPIGGGTAVLRITGDDGKPIDDLAFAVALAKEEKVCVPPAGFCFGHEADGSGTTDLKGFLRCGIVMGGDTLERGLAAIKRLRQR